MRGGVGANGARALPRSFFDVWVEVIFFFGWRRVGVWGVCVNFVGRSGWLLI